MTSAEELKAARQACRLAAFSVDSDLGHRLLNSLFGLSPEGETPEVAGMLFPTSDLFALRELASNVRMHPPSSLGEKV